MSAGPPDLAPSPPEPTRHPGPTPLPRWRPRVVVSDLDGTFLSPDGTVSPVNAAAVREAEAAGIEVLFATGRPTRWLQVVADLGLTSTLVIASNGAVVYDLVTDRVLTSHPIEPALLAAVARDLAAELPGVGFGVEHGSRFSCTPGYLVRADVDVALERFELADLAGAAGSGALKLLVQQHRLGPDALAEVVEPVVGGRLTVTHSASDGTGLLELSAPGVSKASTLAAWCAGRGVVAAEVAAFGDMPNDREMLRWVGRPHVMAHAHPSLADLGARTIGSNTDSAVGRTLRSWL